MKNGPPHLPFLFEASEVIFNILNKNGKNQKKMNDDDVVFKMTLKLQKHVHTYHLRQT